MFDWLKTGKATEPRKGMPSPQLDEAEFKRRFLAPFNDPCFDRLAAELARVGDAAWDAYINSRKAPRTRKAGPGYADPDYELALDWIAASEAITTAARQHDDAAGPNRILLINGSSRSEHHLPGRDVQIFQAGADRAGRVCAGQGRRRFPRPVAPDVGIRPPHSSVQSLFLDLAGAVSLAVLLLSELRPRADA